MASNFLKIKKGLHLSPHDTDPINPLNGDMFYSDGTSRTKGLWIYTDGSWSNTADGSTIDKTQATHGFDILDAIYHNGTNWALAQADSTSTLAEFIVTEVIDVNTFKASKFGSLTITSHGLSVGDHYFLSDIAAGDALTTEPLVYSSPLFYVEDANTIQLEVYRPSFTSTPVPVQKIAFLKDIKSSGSNGGDFVHGAWRTRVINNLSGDTSFISLSANQFTLQIGKYSIEGFAPFFRTSQTVAKVYNITDSTDDIISSPGDSYNASATAVSLSHFMGEIEITTPTIFELQHKCTATNSTQGLGIAGNLGVNEVYSQIKITKIQ